MSEETNNEVYEHKYLADFAIGENFVGVWKVNSTEVKVANGGKNKYTEFHFQDKSDIVKAVFFGMAPDVKAGDFALVDLSCQDYNGLKSFKVHKIFVNEGPDATPINQSWYFDVFDTNEYKKRLCDILEKLHPDCHIVEDLAENAYIEEGAIGASVPSNSVKYNKPSGALAHSVSLAEACYYLGFLYDLSKYEISVLVGACLCSKIGARECFTKVSDNEYTPNKNYHLFGIEHMSCKILERMLIDDDFSKEYRDRIIHCLLANEVTDCKPLTKEAYVYSKIVYMDTLVRGFSDSYDKGAKQKTDFTIKDFDFKRQFYVKPAPEFSKVEVKAQAEAQVETVKAKEEANLGSESVLEACATTVPVGEEPPF